MKNRCNRGLQRRMNPDGTQIRLWWITYLTQIKLRLNVRFFVFNRESNKGECNNCEWSMNLIAFISLQVKFDSNISLDNSSICTKARSTYCHCNILRRKKNAWLYSNDNEHTGRVSRCFTKWFILFGAK